MIDPLRAPFREPTESEIISELDGLEVPGVYVEHARRTRDPAKRMPKRARYSTKVEQADIEKARELGSAIVAECNRPKPLHFKKFGFDLRRYRKALGPKRRETDHLDHVFPLSKFSSPLHPAAWHPANLRWVGGEINRIKSSKTDKRAFRDYLKSHLCGDGDLMADALQRQLNYCHS